VKDEVQENEVQEDEVQKVEVQEDEEDEDQEDEVQKDEEDEVQEDEVQEAEAQEVKAQEANDYEQSLLIRLLEQPGTATDQPMERRVVSLVAAIPIATQTPNSSGDAKATRVRVSLVDAVPQYSVENFRSLLQKSQAENDVVLRHLEQQRKWYADEWHEYVWNQTYKAEQKKTKVMMRKQELPSSTIAEQAHEP
jgi:hypothetical protein